MPKMTGHECLLHLKQIEHLKYVPIAIYSTSTYIVERERLLEKGADYYVNKSNPFKELVLQIREVIEKALCKVE